MSALARAQAQRRAERASPPALTGGETQPEAGGRSAACVDWLSLTFTPEAGELVDRNVWHWLSPLLGGAGGESVNGFHQFENGLRFWHVRDGTCINLGRLDWGGDKRDGRARLELTGNGCARVVDWDLLRAQIEQLGEVKLTRVDLAVDCLEGEYDVDDAVEWYQEGVFVVDAPGGCKPRHSLVGDWLDADHKHGRTLEIGRRENGKMCRVYEKGRQLGDQTSPWVRFEVELRNNDRELPLDMLTAPDRFFAGAYRCLERLLGVAGERIKTHQKEGEIALDVMSGYARDGYGQVLHVLRAVGLSFEDVFNEISRPGIPRRLERASLSGFTTGDRLVRHH
jgi:phage replication initiation protein